MHQISRYDIYLNAFLYIQYIIILAEITINYVTLIFVQIGNDNGHET